MKFIHYINKHYEEEQCLYDVDRQQIIFKGDGYHNKISFLIKGFLMGINKYNISYEYTEEIIDRNHELYEKFDFYDDGDW